MDDFEIAGVRVAPRSTRRVEIPVARLVTQTELSLPATVVHGAEPGERL